MSKKQEMIQFFIDKANAGDGVDNDGAYGFQCADVPCYGLRHWYGVTLWGNAYDLLESARSQGLKVVYDVDYPKAGWFFVKSYVAGDGVNYGHTGLVYEDSDGYTIKTIEQNIDGNWDYLEVGGPCRYNERSVSEIVISCHLKKSKSAGNRTSTVGGGFVKTAHTQLTNGRKSMMFGTISMIKAS